MSVREYAPGLCVAATGRSCPVCGISARRVWMVVIDRPSDADHPLRICRSCAELVGAAMRPARSAA